MRKKSILIIVITVHGFADSALDVIKLRAANFLQKPFFPEEIRESVVKVIKREFLKEKWLLH